MSMCYFVCVEYGLLLEMLDIKCVAWSSESRWMYQYIKITEHNKMDALKLSVLGVSWFLVQVHSEDELLRVIFLNVLCLMMCLFRLCSVPFVVLAFTCPKYGVCTLT